MNLPPRALLPDVAECFWGVAALTRAAGVRSRSSLDGAPPRTPERPVLLSRDTWAALAFARVVCYFKDSCCASASVTFYTHREEFFFLTYLVLNSPGHRMCLTSPEQVTANRFKAAAVCSRPPPPPRFDSSNCPTLSPVFSTVQFSNMCQSLSTNWNLTVVSHCLFL